MLDFNSAKDQFDLIPNNTIAKLLLRIKKGGYNNQGFNATDGVCTKSKQSDTVFLSCEYQILSHPFEGRKIFGNIGIWSAKGPTYGDIGASFIKGILNSANYLRKDDTSEKAIELRKINNYGELDGLHFVGRIIQKDGKNEVCEAITIEHEKYQDVMSNNFNLNTYHFEVNKEEPNAQWK